MYKAFYLSPMIPSYDLTETANFFTDIFGFATARKEEHFIILYKDNHTIHILTAGKDIGEMEFYLEVDNIDALWQNIKPEIEGMKVREPFDREYGMREFHIVVPHTKTLMFVGQELH